jgi:hypothetical protein
VNTLLDLGGVTIENNETLVYGNSQAKFCPISDWVLKLLPQELQTVDLDSYLVIDETVTLLESEVNGIEINEPSTLPEWLRKIMIRSDVWLIAFLWHWDEIDEVQQMSMDDGVRKLCRELRWNSNRHGFCIFGFTRQGSEAP